MLRIAKTSPGVLDLSAVKDEFGLPVILNGPSHRDVPDHEESNPVLQRVVEVQWVTLTSVPIEASSDDAPAPDDALGVLSVLDGSENPAPKQLETSEGLLTEDDNVSSSPAQVSHEETRDTIQNTDVSKPLKNKTGRRT